MWLQNETFKIAKHIVSRRNSNKFRTLNLKDAGSIRRGLDLSVDTGFMIHGYSTSFDAEGGMLSTWARVVSESLDANIVVVDWSDLAFDNYGCLAHETVPAVANFVARAIYTLFDHGVRPESILFGGHCLGAHIGGLAADQIRPKPKAIAGTSGNYLWLISVDVKLNDLSQRLIQPDRTTTLMRCLDCVQIPVKLFM